MTSRVERHADRYRDEVADRVLEASQRDSGTEVRDAGIRDHLLEMLRTRVAPAALARAAARLLRAEGYQVALWGAHWPADGRWLDVRRGPIPTGEALNRIYQSVATVVLPLLSPMTVQMALDALVAGARVLIRRPAGRPLEQEYPDLADVLSRVPSYGTSGELLDWLRELTARGDFRDADPCQRARELATTKHTISRRLVSILDTFHRRQSQGA